MGDTSANTTVVDSDRAKGRIHLFPTKRQQLPNQKGTQQQQQQQWKTEKTNQIETRDSQGRRLDGNDGRYLSWAVLFSFFKSKVSRRWMAHQEKKRNFLINKREREKETRAKGSLCRRYTDGMIDGQTDGSSSSIRRARAARLRVADDPPLERRADECRYEGGRFPPSERVGRQHQIGRREKKATRDSWAVRKKEKEMAGQKKRKKRRRKQKTTTRWRPLRNETP